MSDEDDVSTQLITKLDWIKPVATTADLPKGGVKEGTMCFVEAEGEEEIWKFTQGKWERVDEL